MYLVIIYLFIFMNVVRVNFIRIPGSLNKIRVQQFSSSLLSFLTWLRPGAYFEKTQIASTFIRIPGSLKKNLGQQILANF